MAPVILKYQVAFFIGALFLIGNGCHITSSPLIVKETPLDSTKSLQTLADHYPRFDIQIGDCYGIDRKDTVFQSNSTNYHSTIFDTSFISGLRKLYGSYQAKTPIKVASGRIQSLSGIISIPDTRAFYAEFTDLPFNYQQDSSVKIVLVGKDVAARTNLLLFVYYYYRDTRPMASGQGSWTVTKYSDSSRYLWTDTSQIIITFPYVK